jgi:predicted nucleic acid-binding Zn ribbon protein
MPMPRGEAALNDILGGLIKKRRLGHGIRKALVLTRWAEVVGVAAARKSWPEHLQDGVLTVGVSDHAWLEQLHLLAPQILARYTQVLGKGLVKEIVFHFASRRRKKNTAPPEVVLLHPTAKDRLPVTPLPEQLLAEVADPELRARLAPAFARLRASRAWKEAHGWRTCAGCGGVTHASTCAICGMAGPE